jgi:magnesium transporter
VKPLLGNQAKKAGAPPGATIYTGAGGTLPVSVALTEYGVGGLREARSVAPDDLPVETPPGRYYWVDVDGVHDVALLERLGSRYDLHPITTEDLASVGQRPKVEVFDEYVYIVLRMLWWEGGALAHEQLSLIVTRHGLLSFQETPDDVLDGVRARLRNRGRAAALGPDYLAYAVMDAVLDTYFTLLERYGDRAEALEERLLERPTPQVMLELNAMKRELLFIRKAAWPLRDLVGTLERERSPIFGEVAQTYLRDLHDHAVQIIETVELLRDVLTGLHDLYLSSLSYKMNETMRVLTVIGTIFLPLTFLVGVYGMNFEAMPELRQPWAYPALWGVMIALAVGMLAYFRRRGWV